jgi:hypothetical protein
VQGWESVAKVGSQLVARARTICSRLFKYTGDHVSIYLHLIPFLTHLPHDLTTYL